MVNTIYLFSFVETPRKFIIAELLIRKLGSSSVLIIHRNNKCDCFFVKQSLEKDIKLVTLNGKMVHKKF